MTLNEVMSELESMGSEQTKKILMRHGAREPLFGVKVGDLKKIVKKVKKNHNLSLELYNTGNSDAMYLAGLIADESKITKTQLQDWADNAYWYMISEFTVPWVAAESPFGYELALEWIKSKEEKIAAAGWATLSSLVTIKKDDDLNIKKLDSLLDHVAKNIHNESNRVRYTMNGFVIAAGTSIISLTEKAIKIGLQNGKVDVEMGGTACKVPSAPEYIEKNKKMGRIGRKKKVARC